MVVRELGPGSPRPVGAGDSGKSSERDELVQRLLGRAQKEGRTDDTEAVIRHRLDVYDAETAVVVDVYDRRGIVREVDGLGTVDEVSQRIMTALS